MAFAYSLGLAAKFADRIGDSSMASKYTSVKESIEATLDGKNSLTQVTGLAHSCRKPPTDRRMVPLFILSRRSQANTPTQIPRLLQPSRYSLRPSASNTPSIKLTTRLVSQAYSLAGIQEIHTLEEIPGSC